MTTVETLLRHCAEYNASDLHLSAGLPPMMRVDGDLQAMDGGPMSHQEIETVAHSIMSELQRRHFAEFMECDFSFEIPNLSRFRVNAFQQTRGMGIAFRGIPTKMPTLQELHAPALFADVVMRPRGLVLVTGPTGAGKSTTQAAMINHLNNTMPKHILTIEDPMEFVHSPKKCLINQREVGSQTLSFSNALRAALREDPDVILVGEMRDLETIRLALTAAETGHLVLGTLHTSGAPKTIDRIIDVFPAQEKDMVRAMLSESLEAVISQVLVKRKEGSGRVAAHEIMVGTPAIRNLIREGKVAQMYSAIQSGSISGMQTLDQSLANLVKRNLISVSEARLKAKFPDDFPV
jgi:twitching motility protein PilT